MNGARVCLGRTALRANACKTPEAKVKHSSLLKAVMCIDDEVFRIIGVRYEPSHPTR